MPSISEILNSVLSYMHNNTHTHTIYIHTHTYMYTYIYNIQSCICVNNAVFSVQLKTIMPSSKENFI